VLAVNLDIGDIVLEDGWDIDLQTANVRRGPAIGIRCASFCQMDEAPAVCHKGRQFLCRERLEC
jgi:hypothetical protein